MSPAMHSNARHVSANYEHSIDMIQLVMYFIYWNIFTCTQAHEGARSYNDSSSNGLSWRPPLSSHTNSSSNSAVAGAAAVAVSARGMPIHIISSSSSGAGSGHLLEGTSQGVCAVYLCYILLY
jgi:hypothetical protein